VHASLPGALGHAIYHAGELVRLMGPNSFAVKTTTRQILRYYEWLAGLSTSRLGQLSPHCEAVLGVLNPQP
jgi:hypothetical protein